MRSVVFVAFSVFADMLMYGSLIPVLPRIAEIFGLSSVATSVFLGLYAIPYIGSAILIGHFANEIPKRWLVMAGFITAITAAIMLAEAGTVWQLYAARCFQAVSASLIWTAGLACIGESTALSKRPAAFALCTVASATGLIFGPVIGGVLCDFLGLRWCFLLFAGGFAAMLAACPFFLQRTPIPAKQSTRGIRTRNYICVRGVPGLIALLLCSSMTFGVFEVALPRHLAFRFRFSAGEIGGVLAVFAFFFSISSLISAKYWPRLYNRLPLRAGMIVALPSFAVISFADQLYALLAILALFGAGMGLWISPVLDQLNRKATALCAVAGQGSGIASSIYNVTAGTGLAVGAMYGGVMENVFPLRFLFPFLCVVLLLPAMLLPRFFEAAAAE